MVAVEAAAKRQFGTEMFVGVAMLGIVAHAGRAAAGIGCVRPHARR